MDHGSNLLFFDLKRLNKSQIRLLIILVPKNKDSQHMAPHEIGLAARARAAAGLPFRIEPPEGNLAPYEKISIKITFCPVAPGFMRAPMSDSPQLFNFTANVRQAGGSALSVGTENEESKGGDDETIGGNFLQKLLLTGRSVAPKVELSHRCFEFGDCPANDRRDIMVTLKNANSELPITFASDRIAHYSISPASGRLQPLQSMEIVVSFRPNQLGKFSNTLHLVINHGIVTLPLRVSGICDDVGVPKTERWNYDVPR